MQTVVCPDFKMYV